MSSMILPLNGWAAGKLQKSFTADVEFFQAFENEEIKEANEKVSKMAKEQTTKTLNKVLHISSASMKNGFNLKDN